jgi:hypothetical protein
MNKFLMAIISTTLLSCSTIRLQYEGEFKTDDGREGKYVLRKSYPVGSIRTWCMVTGILYGGACWFYFSKPDDEMERRVEEDAKWKLKSKLNIKSLLLSTKKVERLSWDGGEDQEDLMMSGSMNSRPHSSPAIQSPPSGSDEFLR